MNPTHPWWTPITGLAADLDAAQIAYTFEGAAALFLQGVAVCADEQIEVSVQWDRCEAAHALVQPHGATPRDEGPHGTRFHGTRDGVHIVIVCYANTVVETDTDRVGVEHAGRRLWAKSVEYCRAHVAPGDPAAARITQFLQASQEEQSRANRVAWNQGAYDAWVARYGLPSEAAAAIKRHPAARLQSLREHLGDVEGRSIVNLLGSHAGKAVALALLGARVTVVDSAPENARYAGELAREAGVEIRYVVSDVLALPPSELGTSYDIVLMELGIVHYFIDLRPLAQVVARLLRPGGHLVLHEFHPVSTKLIASKGRKHRVTGNYFDRSVEPSDVAYAKFLPAGDQKTLKKVYLRRWTLGEIVTAIADAGLYIRALVEEPNHKRDDMGIPKTFTLVAERLA